MTLPPPWLAARPLPPEVFGPFATAGRAERWVARHALAFPKETQWAIVVLTGPSSMSPLFRK
jgi:hypothetical protein